MGSSFTALLHYSSLYGKIFQMFCEAVGYPKPKVRIMKKSMGRLRYTDVDFSKVDTPLEVNFWFEYFTLRFEIFGGFRFGAFSERLFRILKNVF